jgi:UDP-N-acetylglucosamine--N-acetylmuramyl-(pentapeptide) pyrophosphoryl-undecaprenol N-acetylglucosamine transferase
MAKAQTILLAGGGTGGHLYPGVSVAEALREANPAIKPVFLCTTREIDRTILSNTGFDFVPQPIVPPVKTVSGLIKFWRTWRETQELVRQLLNSDRPFAVLGLGGYAAGVAVKLAAQQGVPTAILNQDVIPGKANRYLLKYVKEVFCQFQETRTQVPSVHWPKLVVTGCPIRRDIRALPPRESAAARLGVDLKLNTLVVTGASQGAQTVNEAVLATLSTMRHQGWQVLHLAGKDHASAVQARYGQHSIPARVVDFTPAMADVFAVADLVVARSGASTCAELTACGLASVLMPYPFHKDMHQRVNAKVLEDAGAAIVLDDQKDAGKNAERMRPILESLLFDTDKRRKMADASRQLGKPDAADQVASALVKCLSADQ